MIGWADVFSDDDPTAGTNRRWRAVVTITAIVLGIPKWAG